jgi:hypothetical protein
VEEGAGTSEKVFRMRSDIDFFLKCYHGYQIKKDTADEA